MFIMKSKLIGKWNSATEVQQYRIAKVALALLFTAILCVMFFKFMPLSEHIKSLDRVWTYITTIAEVFICMLIQVNIVSFVYNRWIA